MNRDRDLIGSTFEPLEDRRLCSATLVNGVVHVEGTNDRELVSVSEFVSNSELSLGVRFLRVRETVDRLFLPDVTRTTDFVRSSVTRLRVNSFGGNDVINLLSSPVGADVFAGGGSDQIMGSAFNDNLNGDLAIVQGFDGEELGAQLFGTPGNDIIDGNAGNDVLRGGPADDRLSGGAGVDAMFGEAGNDVILARDGNLFETVDGGTGFDTAQVDQDLFGSPRDRLFSIDSILA
jgi:Ca2+-binding RTX toxin-like protein